MEEKTDQVPVLYHQTWQWITTEPLSLRTLFRTKPLLIFHLHSVNSLSLPVILQHLTTWGLERQELCPSAYFSFLISISDFHKMFFRETIRSETTNQTNGFHELKIKCYRSNIPIKFQAVIFVLGAACNPSRWRYPNI